MSYNEVEEWLRSMMFELAENFLCLLTQFGWAYALKKLTVDKEKNELIVMRSEGLHLELKLRWKM